MRERGTSKLRMIWKQVVWMHYLPKLIKSMRRDWLSPYEASNPEELRMRKEWEEADTLLHQLGG